MITDGTKGQVKFLWQQISASDTCPLICQSDINNEISVILMLQHSMVSWNFVVKEIAHSKMKICWKCSYPQAIQNEMIKIMLLSAVWTLVLTAPIHCRGSIGENLFR